MIDCGIKKEDLKMISEIFLRYPKIEFVKIFGSRAKGNYRKNSDIDLALVGDISLFEAEAVLSDLDDLPLPYSFDVKVVNLINNSELLNHIDRVGEVIYSAKQ